MGNPKPVSVTGATYAEFGPRRKGIGTWGKPNWNGTMMWRIWLRRYSNGRRQHADAGSELGCHMDTDNTPFVHLMGSEGGASYSGPRVSC